MTEEACGDCHFWDPNTGVEGGYCRRRSPVCEPRPFAQARWPLTNEDDWCGDFVRAGEPIYVVDLEPEPEGFE